MLHDASVYLIVFPRCAQQPYRRLRRCVSQLLGALSVQEREDVYTAFPWSDPVRRRLHSSSARHRGGFEASGRRKIPRQHLLGQHLLSLMLLTTACQLRKRTSQQPPLPPSARPYVVHFCSGGLYAYNDPSSDHSAGRLLLPPPLPSARARQIGAAGSLRRRRRSRCAALGAMPTSVRDVAF